MDSKITFAASLLLTACGASQAPAGASAPAAQTATTSAAQTQTKEEGRTLLMHAEVPSLPGYESRIYLVEVPAGGETKPYTDSEQTIGYVLAGTRESTSEGAPAATARVGQTFVEAPGAPHRVKNTDQTHALRFVAAGTFRIGEPATRPASEAAVQSVAMTSPASASTGAPEASNALVGLPSGPIPEVKRTLLAQKEIAALPGMESRLYLIEYPPGSEGKVHIHTQQGIGYVLEGSFESSFGDGPVAVKHAGDGFVDLPGKPHHFRNAERSQGLRFLFAGSFHKDEPLFNVVTP
jgi:quercetin dioxygenase-like cupin family protein